MDPQPSSLPYHVLDDVRWSYWERTPYASRAEFEAVLTECMGKTWNPDGEALRAGRIRLEYFGIESPDDDDYEDFTVEITSDDGATFTQGELMFKVHNAVVSHLSGADHCYFEGLTLREEGEDGVPVYELGQGS